MAEIMENEEEECDTDLERQNVEELYDFVRHVHQREDQNQVFDVQQPALIPVLRPYQRQAVNWMLRKERYKSECPQGKVITPVTLLCPNTKMGNELRGKYNELPEQLQCTLVYIVVLH